MRTFCSLWVLLILNSCAFNTAKMNFLNDDFGPNAIQIKTAYSEIVVNDLRSGVNGREINIPTISRPNQQDRVFPPLTEEQINLIKREVGRYMGTTPNGFHLTVDILAGSKEFQATYFQEKEKAKVNLQITLTDNTHTPYYLQTSAESYCEMSSIDASPEYLEKLYQKAIRYAVYKCMQGIVKLERTPTQTTKPTSSRL